MIMKTTPCINQSCINTAESREKGPVIIPRELGVKALNTTPKPMKSSQHDCHTAGLNQRQTRISCSRLWLIAIGITFISWDACSQTSPQDLLQQAEARFRAIYDQNKFRAPPFVAEWLPDSSGYTVLESGPDAREEVRVRYDAASHKRSLLIARHLIKHLPPGPC